MTSEQLFPSLKGQGMIGLDVEAKDPDIKSKGGGAFRNGKLCGISVATEAGFGQYYPIAHESGPNLPRDKVLKWLGQELGRADQPKVGAHLLYDCSYLHVEGVEVRGPLYDVQNAEPLIADDRMQYGLGPIAKDYLGVGKTDEQLDEFLIQHFGKKNPKGNIWRAPPEVVAPYAVDDARLPIGIFKKQRPILEEQGLWKLFDMESRLIPMLLAMKARGVQVNLGKCEAMLARLTRQKEDLIAEIRRTTGHEVEIWAAKSIQKVFDAEGLEYPRTPKTKQASFTASFLERHPHPMAKMIVEARRMDKMCGTFLQGGILESHVNGRIHCQFNQLKGEGGGAVSGRFSSSNPNLQFIPVRTEEGKRIREMFEPDGGQSWYKIDWSQIEYRLIVHDAASANLPKAREVAQLYHDDPDTDFHKAVADMTGLSRSQAKTINFGLAYGEGLDKLCAQLDLSREDGEKLMSTYHRQAPFIRRLAQAMTGQANTTGEVRTLLNRLRHFRWFEHRVKGSSEPVFLFNKRPPGARRAFTHAALNARIQGSAADIMKKAMVDIWESGVCGVLGVPQLTVHDELDGSLPRGRAAKEALREVKHIMENVVELLVPLKADLSTGPNWGECK